VTVPQGAVPEKFVRPVMPELDSLRGVAILLVLFFHGFNLPVSMTGLSVFSRVFLRATLGGWAGVNLFFVLSGFLITGILLDTHGRQDYYRRFYIRRALRILPAFYLLLLLLLVLPRTGWFEGRKVGLPFIALSFFYLANVTQFFGVPSQYAPLWSLAVEEHFYLVWPMLVRAFRPRRLAYCALGVFLACPLLRAFAYWRGYSFGAGYTWLVADGLAAGGFMALLVRRRFPQRSEMRLFSIVSLAIASGIFAGGTPFGIWRGSTFIGGAFRLTAINLFCAGILGVTLLIGTSRLKWVVTPPILRWFGEISYGLYLIHMLAFDLINYVMIRYFAGLFAQLGLHFWIMLLRFLAGTGIAVSAAWLSRRYFEERFLKLKDRWVLQKSSSASPGERILAAPERRTA